MKNRKVRSAIFLAFCLALGVTSPAGRAAEQDVEQAESKIDAYEQQVQEAQDLLDSLDSEKENTASYLAELNSAVTQKQTEIDNLRVQIEEKEDQMAEVQVSLAAAQEEADRQYENMKLRIQYMYESGADDYWNLLFSAQSLTELLSNSEYISQISEYDRDMLDVYQQTLSDITQYQGQLEAEQSELDTLLAQAEGEQAALNLLAAEQNEQLEQVAAQISLAQSDLERSQADLAEEEELLAYLEAELERQAQEALRQAQEAAEQASREASIAASESAAQAESSQEANGGTEPTEPDSTTSASGSDAVLTLTWPLPSSHRITSYFGPRPDKPVEGVAEFHNGIDIAAPAGDAIVAAEAGTVYYVGDGTELGTTAGGYQVWLVHENGVYMTTYMHCSSLVAQQGQYVQAGDVIARVGTTGLSTGNHLDFRVVYQGSYIDPLGSMVMYR